LMTSPNSPILGKRPPMVGSTMFNPCGSVLKRHTPGVKKNVYSLSPR
jgi:hypothetical protein